MSEVLFQGYYKALREGSLDGTPDVRHMLVMSGFTGETEEDSINLADVSDLDEFDGLGYTRYDPSNVALAYDATDNADYLDHDDEGTDDAFGDPVAPGSDDVYGMVTYLHVDGTDANDIILGFTDTGGFGVNAANGKLDLKLPTKGLLKHTIAP